MLKLIERERIDLVCFQEGHPDDPVLDAFFSQGWYRDRTKRLASRYPIVSEGKPLPDEWDTEERYPAQFARARVRAPSGTEFVLASIHIPTLRPGFNRVLAGNVGGLRLHIAWWRHEMARVFTRLPGPQDAPVLAAGDFNMPSDSSTMAALQPFYHFGFEEAGWGYGYTRPTRCPWFRIDHILASPEWRVTRCWVRGHRFRVGPPAVAGRSRVIPFAAFRAELGIRMSMKASWLHWDAVRVSHFESFPRPTSAFAHGSGAFMATSTTQHSPPSLSPDDLNLLIHANHWDPFGVLGPHEIAAGGAKGRMVRAFLPEARRAWVVDLSRGGSGTRTVLERVHGDGLFEHVFSDRSAPFPYRLAVEDHEGNAWEFVDAYQFGPVLTDFDLHLLGEGTHYRNFRDGWERTRASTREFAASTSPSGPPTRSA